MSTKIKQSILILSLMLAGGVSFSQATIEMKNNFIGVLGPTINPIGPVNFEKDALNNNFFTTIPLPADALSVTVSFQNQTYSGLTYSNISTGLAFGAEPSTAFALSGEADPNTQKVYPLSTYNVMGYFGSATGAPTDNMFTSSPSAAPTVQSGTGFISSTTTYNPPAMNGINSGFSIFTAAQVLHDLPSGVAPHNTATRYYYGDVVLTFNRFVNNPVIHIAGLGGSYRFRENSAGNPWKQTFFSTELEVSPGYTLTRMSGNQFFNVSGSSITNSSTTPNGASVATTGTFNDLGAATGSFKINGPVRTVRLRVYLRGSNASDFSWSTVMANIAQNPDRNPFTGDIWWVSASSEPSQLIPLPATGLNLNAALNGNDVQLNWKTLSEANSMHFEIERSTDGINFSQIATKAAAGSSYTERNYNLTDANMTSSVYYYRVRLVDFDGKFTYSNVAIVRKSGGIKGVRMFPNPVVNQVNLEFSNAKGNYVVSVYNQAGQEVITQKTSITNTVQYVTINRNNLADGSYIVRVRNTENSEVLFAEKMILQ